MRADGSTPMFQIGRSWKNSWLDSVAACIERVTQHTYGLTRGQKCGRKRGACPHFLCSQDVNLRAMRHGDDFCVVARRKQFEAIGTFLKEN